MARKILTAALVLAALGGGVSLYVQLRPAEAESEVRTVEARRGTLVEVASATGRVEPDVQVEVKSRVSGEVVEVAVAEGDQVEAGQLLLRLDPVDEERALREARVGLSRTRADLAQARASLTVARGEAEESGAAAEVRARGAEMGLVPAEERRTTASAAATSRATVELREAQVRSAQASVEAARLAVEEAERRLTQTTITAPVAGTVLSVEVERGSIVASGITNVAGGTALMTIADLSDLRVVGDLAEAQVGAVEAGQRVVIRVDAYPHRTFGGRVERVSPLGVETSNVVTFDVEVVVEDEEAHLLRSGMSADLEIVTARHEDVVLVPVTAVHGGSRERWVVLASGERRAVRTGATDGTDMVVIEGLSGGELLAGSSRPTGGSKQGDRPRGLIPGPGGGGRGR